MHVRKNRYVHCPTGIPSSAIHDIKKYTFNHYNIIKKRNDTNPCQSSGLEKKADLVSVCFDGEQTCWVNRLQCVQLLFLRCITATTQPDEQATLQDCAGVTPQRFPLSIRRSSSLLFHYVMLWQAILEWLTGVGLACALNAIMVCIKILGCQTLRVLHVKIARGWRSPMLQYSTS